MNIVFCLNELGVIGLGATLTSMVKNCKDNSQLRLYLICNKLSNKTKQKILNLLNKIEFRGECFFKDYIPENNFGKLPSLHGDYTPYSRLSLSELLSEEIVLYLDTDLIINTDILDLLKYEIGESLLAAVSKGSYRYALGSEMYSKIFNIDPDTKYFNSGVMIINLRKWRELSLGEKCKVIGEKHKENLVSHDQTILNLLCEGKFYILPDELNCAWYAHQKQNFINKQSIIHFVGSPKPWDLFGNYLHNGYEMWKQYNIESLQVGLRKNRIKDIKRLWHIRRSYIKIIIKKLSLLK